MFEMHEAVQDAHQKFLTDLQQQSAQHTQEKNRLVQQVEDLSEKVNQLTLTDSERTNALDANQKTVLLHA